jgi:LPS-assembly protein
MRVSAYQRLALCTVLLWSGPLLAAPPADTWRYCSGPLPVPPPRGSVVPSTGGELNFSADQAVREGSQHYRLDGNVAASRGDQYLEAEHMDYDAERDYAKVDGGVRYARDGEVVLGEHGELSLAAHQGYLDAARFWLVDKHIRGDALKVNLVNAKVMDLSRARFTTCEEGAEDWTLKASKLRLDTGENEGVAYHARVEFMHVPVFYFPYLSFPLEGRKSGFLVPAIGDSRTSGTQFSLPYYWNIAPNRDATLTPNFMSRRGVLWQGEFRYLNPHSQGQLNLAELPHDQVYGADRKSLDFSHRGEPAPGWRTSVNYRYTSDRDYLYNFGGQLSASSVTYLERRGELAYRNDAWQSSLLVQGFQNLDPTLPLLSRPYQRLPQLTAAITPRQLPGGLQLDLQAEAVRFERDAGVVGTRLDVQPRLSWPWRGAPGFLVPSLTLRDTRYSLSRQDPTGEANPQRRLPLFSLDGGLVFERELTALGSARMQTLEPRLFYLYVPYRDQADLIRDEAGRSQVFDSSLPVFGFSQLFRENRFSGADRVGDANQLSATISSRFLDARGRELASVALGRIFYFQDRRVTLPRAAVETADKSNWVAELKSRWTPTLSTAASVERDDKAGDWMRGSFDLRYRRDKRKVLNLGYRYERRVTRQFDVSLLWPLAARWNLVGRWLRSLQDDLTLESLKGIEYNDCCWAFRVVQRTYRVDAKDETESDSLWLQLELRGLTSVGRKVEDLLERDILAP